MLLQTNIHAMQIRKPARTSTADPFFCEVGMQAAI